MDYISVKEASGRWNVTERWVQKLCEEERIEGVRRFGRLWMIPKDAVRPDDLRKHKQLKTHKKYTLAVKNNIFCPTQTD